MSNCGFFKIYFFHTVLIWWKDLCIYKDYVKISLSYVNQQHFRLWSVPCIICRSFFNAIHFNKVWSFIFSSTVFVCPHAPYRDNDMIFRRQFACMLIALLFLASPCWRTQPSPNSCPRLQFFTTNVFLVRAGIFTHQKNGCYSDTPEISVGN